MTCVCDDDCDDDCNDDRDFGMRPLYRPRPGKSRSEKRDQLRWIKRCGEITDDARQSSQPIALHIVEDAMITFQWNRNFITGLATVDAEHHGLVDLINRLGNLVSNNQTQPQQLNEVYDELANYARFHFSNEERLMRESGIDPRHIDGHVVGHRRFLDDITTLRGTGAIEMRMMAARLLDYLVHWLSYHILRRDQDMAHQIRAVEDGLSAAEAYQRHERTQDSVEPLLVALNGLLQEISSRNHDLQELNRDLEARVADRTRELSEANKRLEALSETDVLTGLPNRRQALRRLNDLWTADAARGPLAVLMIDADNFKPVNDRYGHDAGDAVLIELSQTLAEAVRTDDVICRLGGDEFLAICRDTDLAGALHLAELLLQAVARLRVRTGEGYWDSGISIGAAERRPEMESSVALIKAADESLYLAKASGRNCARAVTTTAAATRS